MEQRCYAPAMDTFNRILLFAHVVGGFLALVIAPLAMATRKGGRWHIIWGRIYFWTMMWAFASAVTLLFTKRFVFFLLGVSVLAFYDTFTGVRCLYLKNEVAANARGKPLDWALTAATLLFGAAMVGYGVFGPQNHPMLRSLNVIFGGLILAEAIKDVRRYFRPSEDPKWWWYYHMDRMLGSWVTGVTAIAVSQIGPRVPPSYRIWVWIGPAIVIAPMIALWVRYYRKKFALRQPLSSVAAFAGESQRTRGGTAIAEPMGDRITAPRSSTSMPVSSNR